MECPIDAQLDAIRIQALRLKLTAAPGRRHHICALYDVGRQEVEFVVRERLEGEMLAGSAA
jgi:hypothetical protein